MKSTRQPARKRQSARKNLRLDQHSIDVARRILGTKTETETVSKALDLVAFRKELVDGVRAMRGVPIKDFGK